MLFEQRKEALTPWATLEVKGLSLFYFNWFLCTNNLSTLYINRGYMFTNTHHSYSYFILKKMGGGENINSYVENVFHYLKPNEHLK